jgi:hypothetical protein
MEFEIFMKNTSVKNVEALDFVIALIEVIFSNTCNIDFLWSESL